MISSSGCSSRISSASSGNSRPITAATVSTWLAVSDRRARRWLITCLTPSGTSSRLSASSWSPSCDIVSVRLRRVSTRNSGLPSVRSCSRCTNEPPASASPCMASSAWVSSPSSPVSAIRSKSALPCWRESSSRSSAQPSSVTSRCVARTSDCVGSVSRSRCPSISVVEGSAHCRSSRTSSVGCSRAAKASRRVTASNSRKRFSGSSGDGSRNETWRRSAGMKRASSVSSGLSSSGTASVGRCAIRCWRAVMKGW